MTDPAHRSHAEHGLSTGREVERGVETRERLLDAAELLFAERGFAGTSMRAITRSAASSLSAVNYHFGSKEGLLRETLLRRIEPVNRLRVERLDALEQEACGDGVPLEAVLRAFLAPALEVRASSSEAPARFRHVAARLYADPPEVVAGLKRDLFAAVGQRFLEALARALPAHGPRELAIGWQFALGVMVHVIAGHLESIPGLPFDVGDLSDEAVLDHMVGFVAAGLRAMPPSAGLQAPTGGHP